MRLDQIFLRQLRPLLCLAQTITNKKACARDKLNKRKCILKKFKMKNVQKNVASYK